MGEVWRARDSKLDRDVAIKVLPELFSRDPESVQRFHRGAHLLASLNHPRLTKFWNNLVAYFLHYNSVQYKTTTGYSTTWVSTEIGVLSL